MPRVIEVKKARKAQGNCGRCGDPLSVGYGYRHWSFRYGGTQRRCLKPQCSPRQSELTQNEVLVMAYSLGEEERPLAENAEDFDEQVEEAVDFIQEILDTIEEKMGNIEEGFGHTEIEAYQNLEEQQGEVESWMDEVSRIDSVEFEGEGDACAECGLSDDDGDHDLLDEDDEDFSFEAHDFEPEDEFDSEAASEALENAIGECPL